MNGMREEMRLYAEFLAMSKKDRMRHFGYSTQREFAFDNKITEKTCVTWKLNPKFQKYQKDMMRKLAGSDLAEIIDKLKERALEGDVPALKLYLEYARELVKQSEVTVTSEDLDGLLSDVIAIIKKHVKDDDVMNAIASDISELEV